MSVYVDSMKRTKKSVRWPYDTACHMMGDTLYELHEMAIKIGVPLRRSFQGDHYDLTEQKRALAVQNGAKEVSSRELVAIRRKQRVKS